MKLTPLPILVGLFLGLLAPSAAHAARISEPDTVLYGRIVERLGEREFPLASGTLVWNLQTTGPGGRALQLTTTLERLADGRFSYRLRIPHEALAYNLSVKPGALGLSSAAAQVQHLSIALDGRPLTVAPTAVDGFALDQSRRAGSQRIDLELLGASTDTDGDGAPDWWEDQNGLDKYDPTDLTQAPGGDPGSNHQTGSVQTFAEWRSAWFPTGTSDLDAFGLEDADQDGVSNFLEYAFSLDPTRIEQNTPDTLPRAYSDDGRLGVAFLKRAGATDLVYAVEVSDDLFQWTDGSEELEEIPAVTADPRVKFVNRSEPDGNRFFRVRVSRQ